MQGQSAARRSLFWLGFGHETQLGRRYFAAHCAASVRIESPTGKAVKVNFQSLRPSVTRDPAAFAPRASWGDLRRFGCRWMELREWRSSAVWSILTAKLGTVCRVRSDQREPMVS